MKKLNIEEIKKFSFAVLCSIRDICEANNIAYSLTGGTLIGAVRHKGFIPWDDDIDIMMPRPDYDRFISIIKDIPDLPINVLCSELYGDDYPYAFAKACHPDTVLIEKDVAQTDVKLGVYVDIFPVDGIGNSYGCAKMRTMFFQFLHGLKISSNWTSYHPSKLRCWYYEPFRYACYLFSKLLGRKFIDFHIDKFVRRKSFDSAEYVGRLLGDFGSKEIMERALFDKTDKIEFEGQYFDAICDYDVFLNRLYGNYMELPPIEKQVTHHDFEAYLVE